MAEVRFASGAPGRAPDGWSQATVQQSSGGAHRQGRASRPTSGARPRPAPAATPRALPRFTLAQLVLVELGAAAVACGIAARHIWTIVGIVVGVLFAALGVIPVQRRWLYQVLGSTLRRVGRRRQQRRHTGLASLSGPYQVVNVATSGGSPIAVIRAGTTWALPLELRQDSVLNDDPGVALGGLASLLTIEDVALASVRLINIVTPAVVPSAAPAGPGPVLARGATRYCVLTLDTMLAAAALADRGGSNAATAQILRRCAMRAEEVLGSASLRLQPLDEAGAHRLLDSCLGPAAPVTSPAAAATVESGSGIRVGGTYSTTFVVGGSAAQALGRLSELAPQLPGRVVASALVLSPGHGPGPKSTLLVRVSTPSAPGADRLPALVRTGLKRARLPVQRLGGEQGSLLRATTPLGLTEALV